MSKSVSIIIPTLMRLDYLAKVLNSLALQSRRPEEVVVATHSWDAATHQFLIDLPPLPYPLRHTRCDSAGVVANMQAALDTTGADVVAIMDDDITPRHDWTEKVMAHFEASSPPGGVGGRDLLHDNIDWRLREPPANVVGRFTWYGQLRGNHHRGSGPPRTVDVLKGCNCAYDGPLLRNLGFDHSLRGKGAQVGWELSLGFDIKRAKRDMIYDPAILVDHWIAPRHDESSLNRLATETEEFSHMLYNDFAIMRHKAPATLRWGHDLLALLWGSRSSCGAFRSLALALGGDATAIQRFQRVWQAYYEVASLRLHAPNNE